MNPEDKSVVKEVASTLHEAEKEGLQILVELNDAGKELADSLRGLRDMWKPLPAPPSWRRKRWL
jgi:hypothetical protein